METPYDPTEETGAEDSASNEPDALASSEGAQRRLQSSDLVGEGAPAQDKQSSETSGSGSATSTSSAGDDSAAAGLGLGEASAELSAGTGTGATESTNEEHVVAEPAVVETVEDVVDYCASGLAQSRTVRLVFEEKNDQCSWGQDGNSSKKDRVVRARSEEYFSIEWSENELLCDLAVSSPLQSLRFDDELFVTFNDVILLSSYNYNERFQSALPESGQEAFRYDWQDLRGGYNAGTTNYDSTYCLGEGAPGADCQVPNSQTTGAFSLTLAEESSALLSLSALETRRADVGLIVTGDNDSSDCKHTQIILDVQISTVQLP